MTVRVIVSVGCTEKALPNTLQQVHTKFMLHILEFTEDLQHSMYINMSTLGILPVFKRDIDC